MARAPARLLTAASAGRARWLWGDEAVKVRARAHLTGPAGLAKCHCAGCTRRWAPIATRATKGRGTGGGGWLSLDGSCLDVAAPGENGPSSLSPGQPWRECLPAAALRGAGWRRHACAVGAQLGRYADSETTLACGAVALRPDMLCLADRQFFGPRALAKAAATALICSGG